MSIIENGQKAPDFTVGCGDGSKVSLKDYKGKNLVVYFYPKDDTPGCTTEAIDFTNALALFEKTGTEIIGISCDTPEKHEKFSAKHALKVRLGSDPEQVMVNAFGVWVEKNMYGKKYMGIERATFLIDGSGKIAEIWRKVKVKGHVDAVLARAESLS
jgi:thioredoxin-dependent peroxiredoxin